MNTKFKLLTILMCITFLLITLSGNNIASEKTYNIKLGHYWGINHFNSIVIRDVFKSMVEEKTNGKVKVDIFGDCQLGAEGELTEGVRAGTIEMAILGNMLENTLPKLKMLQQPFVFRDANHLLKVLNGPIGEELLSGFKDIGIVALGGFVQGEVHLGNNKRPIRTIEDAKGIRTRVWEGKSIIETIKAIGMVPVVMPKSEAYTALQQGLIAGNLSTMIGFLNDGYIDQLKYITKIGLVICPNYFVINKKFYESLPEEYQIVLKESAIEAAKSISKSLEEKEAEAAKIMEDKHGIEIITVNDEEKKAFKEATQVVLDNFSKEYPWASEAFEVIDNVK